MTVTLGTINTKVAKLIKDENNAVVSSADIDEAINETLKFWKSKRFWFNESVDTDVTFTASTAAIGDMPSDLLFPLSIVIDYSDTRYPLKKIIAEEYDAMNSESTGRPRYYTYRSGSYEVYPYPDLAYTGVVRYLKEYSDLSGTTSNNDFTNNADTLLAYGAASRLSAGRRQDEKMESYFTNREANEYSNLIARTNRMNGSGSIATY